MTVQIRLGESVGPEIQFRHGLLPKPQRIDLGDAVTRTVNVRLQ